ncbi:MAG: hypothetical protein GY729_22760 [Desulfobacteraceae bacterium]|nr:hypothetical protein [Desulfobacteraceae bacterium]
MKQLRKIKPAFWNNQDISDAHPHRPLNFQRKWKLIVMFTSFMALLPLMVMTIVEFNLTRKIIEDEVQNTMLGILKPAAESILYSLDRQTAVMDYLIRKNDSKDLWQPDRIKELHHSVSSLSQNIINISLVKKNNKGAHSRCLPPEPGTNLISEQIGKNRFLEYLPPDKTAPSKLVIYMCYHPGQEKMLMLEIMLDMSFLNHFLISYDPGEQKDIFIVNNDGTLVTSSYFYGEPGIPSTFDTGFLTQDSGVVEGTAPGEEQVLIGYARIPNSSLALAMVKSKSQLSGLWFKPRFKLMGYLVVSIILIILSIMGMATYLVGRIHAADKKRMKALHHAGYANKLASIGRLASGVAHEINNPLAIINEKTGLMLDLLNLEKEGAMDERLAPIANHVLDAVTRCSAITRRLMDFARTMEPCIQLVDIKEVISQILTFFKEEARHRKIEISLDTKGSGHAFECDRGSFQQIFLNLFNNAFTAMEDSGRLDILVLYKKTKEVNIIVSDTGCGIPQKDIHNIFEPFYSVKDNPSATGLGLYVTFGLVKEMKGKILVESKLNKGTKFTLILPVTIEYTQNAEDLQTEPALSDPNQNESDKNLKENIKAENDSR